jgi:hypothetical protein
VTGLEQIPWLTRKAFLGIKVLPGKMDRMQLVSLHQPECEHGYAPKCVVLINSNSKPTDPTHI